MLTGRPKRVASLVAVSVAQSLLGARRTKGHQINVIDNMLSQVLPCALSVCASTGIYLDIGAAPRVPAYASTLTKTYDAEAGTIPYDKCDRVTTFLPDRRNLSTLK